MTAHVVDDHNESPKTTRISTEGHKKSSSSNKVRVIARIRPMAEYEIENGSQSICRAMDAQVLEIQGSETRWFELDAVSDGNSTQSSVYENSGAQQAVTDDLFKGLNCTVLAYGQTGAGKTFTMGTAAGSTVGDMDGVIPRACNDLFHTIQTKCDGNAKVELSYLEIYNEEIRDLLTAEEKPLRLRETLSGEVYVSGLESREVASPQQIGEFMEEASKRRVVASTKMNAVSSRSHAICVLRIRGVMEDFQFQSKLTLVDLAGSERIKKTGAQGNRRQEGININKGLFVLGQVVSTLAEQRPKNKRKPPYRDSKLTRLLQDSLGGNSQTIMIACISPADFNMEETVTTLRYATSARNIQNTATRNVVKSISAEEAAKLERENQLLKGQVKELNDTIRTMTLEAFDMPSLRSLRSIESVVIDTTENNNEDDDMLSTDDVAKTKRIKELEKQNEFLIAKLGQAKVDIRKSSVASAIELPALKVQVEILEEELKEADEIKKENETLWQELEVLKAEVASARSAANKLSTRLEEFKEDKSREFALAKDDAVEVKELTKDSHDWVVTIVIILVFQIVLTTWGIAQMANHNQRRYAFEKAVRPVILSMADMEDRSCTAQEAPADLLPDILPEEL